MQQSNEDLNLDWPTLIERARSGCDEALGEVLESVRNYLLLIAEGKLGCRVRSKFGASDIVQHSMLEAQLAIEGFRGSSEGEFRQWIKRIVINNLTDEARRYTHTHSRSVDLEIPADGLVSFGSHAHLETASWNVRRKEFDQELSQAVAQLSNRQQFVIEARHRHGFDYAEIASQLEVSEAGARKIWSRAAERLRSLLGQSQ